MQHRRKKIFGYQLMPCCYIKLSKTFKNHFPSWWNMNILTEEVIWQVKTKTTLLDDVSFSEKCIWKTLGEEDNIQYNNHLPLFSGHDDVPQLDPRGHPLWGRVWSHPTAGAGAGPAHPQCGDLHQTGGEILVIIHLQILKLLSRRPSPATTARCWGRSRARRSSTSSWTPARNTSTSSSERCCSCRWTMTRYSAEMKKVLLLN